MRTLSLLPIGLSLCTLATTALNADFTQQPDETLPGFKSQQVYDFHGIDNVNVFSGELHLAIPLGPEYPLSSGLNWRLSAHYSSKLWHMWLATCNALDPNCPGQNEYAQRAHVAGYSTIGVGWTLELGYVRPGGGYKAPDGSMHFLDGAIDSNASLRLDSRGDGSYVVRQADGTALYFEHPYSIPAAANGWDFSDEDRNNPVFYQPLRYGLSRIVDRFGNTVLQVNYLGAYPASNAWKVASVQLFNPVRTINFLWGTWTQPGANTFDVLNGIQFPTVGGGTLTSAFAYRADGTFNRSAFDGGGSNKCTSPGPPATKLPFLDAISQSTWTYSFGYELADSSLSGVLTRLTLPTGGTVSYTYANSTVGSTGITDSSPELKAGACFTAASGTLGSTPGQTDVSDPGAGCTDWNHRLQFIDQSPSVVRRTETGLPGELPGNPPAAVQTVTSYARANWASRENPGSLIADSFKVVRAVFVQRADGNGGPITTKHIFSASYSSGAELSRRDYTNCDGSEGPGQPVRSVVQCFRRLLTDPEAKLCGVMESATLINDITTLDLVPSRRETWYGANPIPDKSGTTDGCANSTTSVPCWQDDLTGYDASALEYATVTRSSNSGILVYPQNATRKTRTNWTPVSIPGGTWLPKLYSSKAVTDDPCLNAPCTVTTSYSFDMSNGFLNSSSVADGTYGTLTHRWDRDLTLPDPFDRENAKTETLSASFDSTSFANTRTFRSGLTVTAQRAGIGWKSFDADRDANTGLVTASRDPNGLATAYGYDSLGRLTSVVPPAGELATTYCYLDAGATGEMSAVLVKKGGTACATDDGVPQPGSGPFEAYQYDGIGRLKRQIRRLPTPLSSGSYFAFREIRYNSARLKSFESEWTPCGTSPSATSVRSCFPAFASKGTSYSNFDFLGRARTVQLADGNFVRRSFDDPAGIPNSDFTEFTSMNVGGTTVNAGSRKDILGRLLIVAESAPSPAPYGWYSSYGYNVLDKLTIATVPVTSGDPTDLPPLKPLVTPQRRTFTYDALGLLRSETHPEKGKTDYIAYNALGEVTAKSEGGNSYAYTYDALGRLTTTSANGLQYLSNLYDTDVFGGTGGSVLGKLVQQNAYHPLSDQNIRVAHNYAYGGLGGRLSVDDSYALLGSVTLFRAPATFTWNALGLLDTHGHARTAGSFRQSTTYVSGLPYAITADGKPFVPRADYNPSGGLLSYQTANGVTTVIDADPNLIARPAQIRTTGADLNFATGTYSYDGSGNITAIGGDTFTIDARGRLTRGAYAWPGSPYDVYTYDVFGNQTNRTWEAGSQTLTTDPSTNRLVGPSYDSLGNLTINGTDQHWYDALSRQTRYVGPGANERYYYDGAGERFARVVFASSLPQQSAPESFYTLTPCRILDTRNPAGTYGGPALASQRPRSFPAVGVCGIPSNAKALALNVTTVNATAASGNVRLSPTGLSYQPLGTASAYRAGRARASQVFGSIDGPVGGSFTLFNDAPAGYPVDVIVDVSGYFALAPGVPPPAGDSWFVTVRDLEKRPSTEFRYDAVAGTTTVLKDYVYFGNQLVGTYTTTGSPSGTVFYTNDHLGSPRFLTDGASPTKLAEYRYRAFGLALSSTIPGQGPEFASMERDLSSSDLYDHARYVGGRLGRFKSADQVGGHAEDPQSWNRYAYARNNPLSVVDPNGREGVRVSPPPDATLRNWTPAQRAEENMKNAQRAEMAERGELVVGGGTKRSSAFRAQWEAANGPLPPGKVLDHQPDLQLGGTNDIAGGQPLDPSVNSSNGVRTSIAIRGLEPGTVITSFKFTVVGFLNVAGYVDLALQASAFSQAFSSANGRSPNLSEVSRFLTTGDGRSDDQIKCEQSPACRSGVATPGSTW